MKYTLAYFVLLHQFFVSIWICRTGILYLIHFGLSVRMISLNLVYLVTVNDFHFQLKNWVPTVSGVL